jgi:capsular exopolysaccharide synthesis family protein
MSLSQAPSQFTISQEPSLLSGAEFRETVARHSGRIALITAIFFLAAVLYVLLTIPRFAVSGHLYLGDARNYGPTSPASYDGLGALTNFQSQSDVNTQVDLLNDPALIERAIFETGLNADVHKAGVSAAKYATWVFSMGRTPTALQPGAGDLQVLDASLQAPDAAMHRFVVTMGQGGNYEIQRAGFLNQQMVLRGRLGVAASGGGLSLLLKPAVDGAPPAPGTKFDLNVTPAEEFASQIMQSGALQIEAGGTSLNPTNVVALTLTSATPFAAQRFVDQMMSDFVSTQIAWKTEAASETEGYLQQQLASVGAAMANADQKLAAYQAQTGILDVPENAKAIISRLSQYEVQRTNTELQRDALQNLLTEMNTPGKGLSPYLVSQTSDSVLQTLAADLAEAEVQMQALSVQYTGRTVAVQSQQASIDQLQSAIRTVVENDLALADSNLAKVDGMISQFDDELKTIPQESRKVTQLTQSSEIYDQLYTLLSQKAEEADISRASTVNDTRVASPAEIPLQPARPRPVVTILAGTLMGLLTGFAFAFGKRAVSGKVQSAEEVTKLMRSPLYGMLPAHRHRSPQTKVYLERAQDPFTEAMRFVRDNIYQRNGGGKGGVLLITSPTAGDGRTEAALNLVRSLADDGKKTILVDADLRKPSQAKTLQLPTRGTTDGAASDGDLTLQVQSATGLSDWIATTKGPNFEKYPNQEFYVMQAGPLPLNPVELLNRDRFGQALKALRETFDYVVIDSPPLPAVADGLTLAKQADVVLSVVRPCHTERRALLAHDELLGRLTQARGLILNDVPQAAFGYVHGHEALRRAGLKTRGVRGWFGKLWRAMSK